MLKKADLGNLKSDVDELDIDKLKNVPNGLDSLKSKVHKLDVDSLVPVPTDLNKLSDVLKNEVVKKDGYDELVKKVYTINNSDLDEKIEALAAQAEIKSAQNKIVKLETYD